MDGWSTVKGLRYRISSWAHSWTPTQLSQILQGGGLLAPPGGSKEAGCGVLGQCSVSTFNPLAGQSWTTTQCSSLIRDSALTRNDAKWILNINKHASTSITAATPTAPHADEAARPPPNKRSSLYYTITAFHCTLQQIFSHWSMGFT